MYVLTALDLAEISFNDVEAEGTSVSVVDHVNCAFFVTFYDL